MSYNDKKPNIVIDVNVWIDALDKMDNFTDWRQLANIVPSGLSANAMNSVMNLVKAQLSGAGSMVRINNSSHILNLVQKRLHTTKKWDLVKANIAVSEIAKFCLSTGGDPSINWKTVLRDVKATIDDHVRGNDNIKDSINNEDIIVLATAVAANSKILVSNDGGLELMKYITRDAFDLDIIFPRLLSNRVSK